MTSKQKFINDSLKEYDFLIEDDGLTKKSFFVTNCWLKPKEGIGWPGHRGGWEAVGQSKRLQGGLQETMWGP